MQTSDCWNFPTTGFCFDKPAQLPDCPTRFRYVNPISIHCPLVGLKELFNLIFELIDVWNTSFGICSHSHDTWVKDSSILDTGRNVFGSGVGCQDCSTFPKSLSKVFVLIPLRCDFPDVGLPRFVNGAFVAGHVGTLCKPKRIEETRLSQNSSEVMGGMILIQSKLQNRGCKSTNDMCHHNRIRHKKVERKFMKSLLITILVPSSGPHAVSI